ncbi:MAG: adenosylcobinamide amidohydrolase [Acidimicrobiales bacterium]
MPAPTLQRVDATAEGRPALVWRFVDPVLTLATAVLGGGLGRRSWIVNAEVMAHYEHHCPAEHAAELAAGLGLPAGEGVVFLTAASVLDVASCHDGGATCDATVGVSVPTWAADADGARSAWQPGTINLVCWVPAPMSDAALANLLVTVTEAKTQALLEAGVRGTGTASDAVAVCCPPGGDEPYGGPRSHWGSRLARAAHASVRAGLERFEATNL